MKRTAYLGLFVVLFAALAVPVFAQQINDPMEYNAYMGVYNEKDPAKKAAAGEKFLTDYPKTTAVTQTYMMILLGYANAGNWPKALETADKQAQMAPALSADDKKRVLLVGMTAAEQAKNNAKLKEYAEKVLAVDPKNVGALVSLSTLLANTTIPTDEAAKTKHLDDLLAITKRALAEPKPDGATDAQWNPIKAQLHDTSAMVLLNQKKYADTIAEANEALKINPKDGYAYYLMGLATKPSVVDAINKYTAAIDKLNENRSADQLTRDDLKATADGLEKTASTKTDELVSIFAKSVACGGPSAAGARSELKIFKGTPEELEKLIADKKTELGVK